MLCYSLGRLPVFVYEMEGGWKQRDVQRHNVRLCQKRVQVNVLDAHLDALGVLKHILGKHPAPKTLRHKHDIQAHYPAGHKARMALWLSGFKGLEFHQQRGWCYRTQAG